MIFGAIGCFGSLILGGRKNWDVGIFGRSVGRRGLVFSLEELVRRVL